MKRKKERRESRLEESKEIQEGSPTNRFVVDNYRLIIREGLRGGRKARTK